MAIRPPASPLAVVDAAAEAAAAVTEMKGLKSLRRGRGLTFRAKRLRMRRKQVRFHPRALRSDFRQAPRKPRPSQPYLPSNANLADLLGK